MKDTIWWSQSLNLIWETSLVLRKLMSELKPSLVLRALSSLFTLKPLLELQALPPLFPCTLCLPLEPCSFGQVKYGWKLSPGLGRSAFIDIRVETSLFTPKPFLELQALPPLFFCTLSPPPEPCSFGWVKYGQKPSPGLERSVSMNIGLETSLFISQPLSVPQILLLVFPYSLSPSSELSSPSCGESIPSIGEILYIVSAKIFYCSNQILLLILSSDYGMPRYVALGGP